MIVQYMDHVLQFACILFFVFFKYPFDWIFKVLIAYTFIQAVLYILDDDYIQWHPPLIGHYTNFLPLLT